MNGFFKVPRGILNIEGMQDPERMYAYIVLLAHARFMPCVTDGVPVEAGQLMMSVAEFAELCNIAPRRAQTILDYFKKIGGISTVNIRYRKLLITLEPLFLTGDESYMKPVGCSGKKQSHVSEKTEAAPEKSLIPHENGEEASVESSAEKMPSETSVTASGMGRFSNVLLSEEEMQDLKKSVPRWESYIERLSAYLAMNKTKDYKNHLAVIYSWFLRDTDKLASPTYKHGKKRVSADKNKPKSIMQSIYPDGRSYDIERAELNAFLKVPKIKKRDPETGRFIEKGNS